MTDTVLELSLDLENNNVHIVYFLYNSSGDILYIGKTTNLRARMRQHFSTELVKLEHWRSTIDKNNILCFNCQNACDLDLYETYFINKYQPLYNKEKIFNSCPTFDFPYIEPIIYKFNLKFVVGDGSFKDNCIKYIEDVQSRELLGNKYPLIKESYEKIGADKMKAVFYLPDKLQNILVFLNSNNQEKIKQELLNNLVSDKFYSLKDIKNLLKNIYKKHDINQTAKAIDISLFLNVKFKTIRQNGGFVRGLEIL